MAIGSSADPRYKCCLNNCHSKTGVKMFTIVELIVLSVYALFIIGVAVIQVASGSRSHVSMVFPLVLITFAVGIQGIVSLSTFYGLKHEKAIFLLPKLIVTMFAIVLLSIVLYPILTAAMFIVGYMLIDNYGNDANDLGLAFLILAIVLIHCLSVPLYMWLFAVHLACFRYFHDKNNAVHEQPFVATPLLLQMTVAALPHLPHAPPPPPPPPPPYTEHADMRP